MKLTRRTKKTILAILLLITAFVLGYAVGMSEVVQADEYTMRLINTTGVSCADVLYDGCL